MSVNKKTKNKKHHKCRKCNKNENIKGNKQNRKNKPTNKKFTIPVKFKSYYKVKFLPTKVL